MNHFLFGKSNFHPTKLILGALATLGAVSLSEACSDNSSTPGPDAGSGASSGSASGSTGGSASGSTSGSASGSTSGSASGSTSGSASGSVSGSGSGSSGSDAGTMTDATITTDGGDAGNGPVCTPACMTATGCPVQSCYLPSANPVPASGLFGIPDNKLLPPFAVDGNLATRYTTGAASVGTEWFQVDLCRTVAISGINLNDTTDPGDVAVAYNVQVSLDGTAWTTVATSTMPAAVNLTVTFTSTMARYVRVNQTGMSPTSNWWSIDEFSVLCGVPGDAGGDAAIDSSASDASSDVASEAASDATGQ